MTPKEQCNACGHKGKGWGHEHCRYLQTAPTWPCTLNTHPQAAAMVARVQFSERFNKSAPTQKGNP